MSVIELKICPLCKSGQLQKYLECKDHYATGESFEIHLCSDCGFKFTQSFPDETKIGRYYDTADYVSHSDTKKGIVNRVYHSVRKRMLNKKMSLVVCQSGKTTGRLLDIGCGTGYFLHTMQQSGWQVTGIEKNQGAATFAREHFGLQVTSEPTALVDLPEAAYDVVTMWHVLEHLQPLHETMDSIYKGLKPDGVALIALPNADSHDAAHYAAHWAAWDVPRHLWHFTPATLNRLAQSHGFEVCGMQAMPFDGFYVSMLSEKYKHSGCPVLKGFTQGALTLLSGCRDSSKSSSIIYVLKKKQK